MKSISEFKSLSEDEQLSALLYFQKLYEEGEPEIDDATFDTLQSIYEKSSGKKFKDIGATPKGLKVKLPYYMGSLDKIKGKTSENDLIKWSRNYKGPWIVEDKMDGISGLYMVRHMNNKVYRNLYTRGDGIEGTDITHLLEYIDIPTPDIDIVVRGELIMNNKDFEELNKRDNTLNLKNPRNTTAGLINSKEVNINIAKSINFYAYNIIDWGYDKPNKELQMKYLQAYRFKLPWYILAEEISTSRLEEALKLRRKEAVYDIDGLVITNNDVYELESGKNPKNSIAFKVDVYNETTVIDVVWEASKDGILKPVVIYEPVNVSGITMSRASGKNAKFIVSNGIGPGALILITRAGDVIPDIVEVLKPVSKNDLILPSSDKGEYTWNDSGIEFVLINKDTNEKVQKERMEFFFKTMDIKNLGGGRVKLLYEYGFDTLYKLLSASPDDIAIIPGLGFKSADTIYNSIQNVINSAPLSKVMAGSGIFGSGFGVKKAELILNKYSNILEMKDMETEELTYLIQDIDGFDKTSEEFAINLPRFVEWLEEHPMIKIKDEIIKSVSSNLVGEKIVFTGFRSDELEKQIKEHGGTVVSAINKTTTILVAKNLSDLKTKGEKAKELGIKIMDLNQFKNVYNL